MLFCSTSPKLTDPNIVVVVESSEGTACASTRPESRTFFEVVSRSLELIVSVPDLSPTLAVLMPIGCGSAAAAAGLLNVPAGAVKPAGAVSEYVSVAAGGGGRSSTTSDWNAVPPMIALPKSRALGADSLAGNWSVAITGT